MNTLNSKNILFVELQCKNIEHVKFNSATIKTFSYIYKNSSLNLFAEKNHSDHIKSELRNKVINEYININFIKSKIKLINHFHRVLILLIQLFKKKYDHIIILSLNTHLIFLLKIFFFFFRFKVIFIAHSELELIKRTNRSYLKNYFSFRTFYFGLNKDSYRFLFLSQPIMNSVLAINDDLRKRSLYFNHPYSFSKIKKNNTPTSLNKLKIGFIGFAHKNKGIHDFLDVSKIFSKEILFSLIGKIDDEVNFDDCKHVEIINADCRDDFVSKISALDFIFMPYPKDKYNLYFSGTALDALEANVPILAYKNKFIDYLFGICGDIGYSIDSKEEAIQLLNNLVDEVPEVQYNAYLKNLDAAKKHFGTKLNAQLLFNQDSEFFL